MRIALEVSGLLDGASGLGFYIERLCAALVRVAPEHEFVFTSAFWTDPARLAAAALPRARNASLLRLRAPQRLLLPAEELGWGWREGRLRAAGIDVLHGMGNVLPPLARLPGVVTMHHIGGDVPPTAWNRFFFGTLPRRSALRADRVIAVSGPTRAALIADWGLDPARVRTVHEGGPEPEFRPSPEAQAAAGVPYVLHVGSLVERKNVANLLRAFTRVVVKDPSRPLRLLLAGRDGDASAEVARLSSVPALAGRVERLGPVTRARLVQLYQGARLVAVPSLLEGFGFPLLEAMACGAPVVAAAAASLPELAGDAALLCDAADPAALAGAIARVLDDADFSDSLRARGPARAAAFSWETAARETLSVLAEARSARKS